MRCMICCLTRLELPFLEIYIDDRIRTIFLLNLPMYTRLMKGRFALEYLNPRQNCWLGTWWVRCSLLVPENKMFRNFVLSQQLQSSPSPEHRDDTNVLKREVA